MLTTFFPQRERTMITLDSKILCLQIDNLEEEIEQANKSLNLTDQERQELNQCYTTQSRQFDTECEAHAHAIDALQAELTSTKEALHLLNDRVIVIGVGHLDCFLTDRREVQIGNEACHFIWLCAEKDVADTNVPVIYPKLTERMEALERGKHHAHCRSIACIPSVAHLAALSNSVNDVYDTMCLPRVESTTRWRVGSWGFDSAPSTNSR